MIYSVSMATLCDDVDDCKVIRYSNYIMIKTLSKC